MTTNAEKRQKMFSMIETWQDSGESQQMFCKSQGMAYSAFHYWYKKYRAVHNTNEPPDFVAVQIKRPLSSSPVAELVLPDGRRLNFYQAVEASFLRTLLS